MTSKYEIKYTLYIQKKRSPTPENIEKWERKNHKLIKTGKSWERLLPCTIWNTHEWSKKLMENHKRNDRKSGSTQGKKTHNIPYK